MVLKLQNKDNELTEYLEEAYFISLSEENPNYEQVVKCLSNLITHYCIKDVEKVNRQISLIIGTRSL